MTVEEWRIWADYLGTLSDVALSNVHLFVRKLTDTSVVVGSDVSDFFSELEDVCMFSICCRFADSVGAVYSRESGSDEQ